MADNLQKRPSKGILKSSSSFDTQDPKTQPNRKTSKETKWDEMNIIATLHPADKDYGHMKIDEPKTPYNYDESIDADTLDAGVLADKLRKGASQLPKIMTASDDSEEDSDEDLSPEQRAIKKDFENKRKKHYNEFYAVKLARKLLEEEDEDDDDDDDNQKQKSSPKQSTPSPDASPKHHSTGTQKPDRDKTPPHCSKYCSQNK